MFEVEVTGEDPIKMVELVKNSSIITAGFITAFTILWLTFPVYLFLLTLLAPLVIIADDVPLFKAVRMSMGFIRGQLLDTGKLILLLLPLWAFVIYLLKLYNEKVPFLQMVIFYLFSLLEIITVKVFLLFYRKREER
ncbi:MAG: hypothetical protein NC932_00140 [Candidatus Omnitrophica bacterium]|nr:hypothetical protein [Candidatus Omnitrophota bacterium]